VTSGRLRGEVVLPRAEDGEVGSGLADLLGARLHVDILIPRTRIAGKMRLLSRIETSSARADARKALADRGIPTVIGELANPVFMDEWNTEVAVRTIALAIRDPQNVALPLDVVEEWLQCDDDQIAALYLEYKDLATRLDPVGSADALTEQEWAAIDGAAKKAGVDTLMSYGSRKLALFAISSAAQPAS